MQYIKLAKTFLGPGKSYEEYVRGMPEAPQDLKRIPDNVKRALFLVKKAKQEEGVKQEACGIW